MNTDKMLQADYDLESMMVFDLEVFESAAHKNGSCYWDARWLMESLEYASWQSFHTVVMKAFASCARIDIPPSNHFISESILLEDGSQVSTYKLTRFAVFLITMHADSKKPAVEKAKVAFSALMDDLLNAVIGQNDLGRIETRADLAAAENRMGAIAVQAGVESSKLGIFKDQGFMGMYNMSLSDLKARRGIETGPAYNFMGLTELAGNLFRVTQTAERLKQTPDIGLNKANQTARQVGAEVRSMMHKSSGVYPEQLPQEEHINKVKSQLKKTEKVMQKLDKPKSAKKKK